MEDILCPLNQKKKIGPFLQPLGCRLLYLEGQKVLSDRPAVTLRTKILYEVDKELPDSKNSFDDRFVSQSYVDWCIFKRNVHSKNILGRKQDFLERDICVTLPVCMGFSL